MPMYTDPEQARSDLFLSGAVYVFGPLLLTLLNPLFRVPVVGAVLAIAAPFVTTGLVPLLMVRYRKESLRDYGLGDERGSGLRLGLVLSLPVVIAVAVALAVAGVALGGTLPAVALGTGSVTGLLANVSAWLGLAILAVYATVKARDAFRADIRSVREGVTEIGRILGVAAGIAALLLLVVLRSDPALWALVPLGAAASVFLLRRRYLSRSTTTRAALLAPVILLAIRPFNPFALFLDAGQFVVSVWSAAFLGAMGLLMAATLESRQTAWSAAALGAMLALFVPAAFVG
jgi:hypothetical protein